MLDSVRQGAPTENAVHTFQERIITVSVPKMFGKLQEEGKVPVCLFPTRKQCNDLNEQMLARLESPKVEMFCSEEVNETKSTNKRHKRAAEQLDKLNKDC